MESLIKITEKEGQNVVSARELHEFLEINTRFDTWVQRMFEYGFEEGLDFCPILSESTGGRPSTDYALTLDCAKEISMLQRNDKGKQARKYFIEVEKKSKSIGITQKPLDLLKLAVSEIEKKEKEIMTLKPKAEFADRVIATEDLIDVGQSSKILGLSFGRNTMFKHLREMGIFFRNRNEPKQEYINRGLFILREKLVEREHHPDFMVMKVLVTQKGLEYLSRIFEAQDNNRPKIKTR